MLKENRRGVNLSVVHRTLWGTSLGLAERPFQTTGKRKKTSPEVRMEGNPLGRGPKSGEKGETPPVSAQIDR